MERTVRVIDRLRAGTMHTATKKGRVAFAASDVPCAWLLPPTYMKAMLETCRMWDEINQMGLYCRSQCLRRGVLRGCTAKRAERIRRRNWGTDMLEVVGREYVAITVIWMDSLICLRVL